MRKFFPATHQAFDSRADLFDGGYEAFFDMVSRGSAASACSDAPPGGNPADELRSDRFGYRLGHGVVVGKDLTLSWFTALVSESAPPNGEPPARIEWLSTASSCTFFKPNVEDQLVQVHTYESEQVSDIYAFSNADVLKRAQEYVSQWQAKGEDPGVYPRASEDP